MYCYFEENIIKKADARIGIGDLALVRGYAVFDYFLFKNYQPRFIEDYITRFLNSAKTLGLIMPIERKKIKEAILALIATNDVERGGIRLLLTGGYSPNNFKPTKGNFIIYQDAFPSAPPIQYTQGARVATFQHQREFPTVKSINYLTGIKIINTLDKQGANYPLYHDGKNILESDRSNFFILNHENELLTAKNNILGGITRSKVILIAREMGITVKEREVSLEELRNAKEAYLTSSIKGVLPVSHIDGSIVGNGMVSTLAKDLHAAYLKMADDQ